MFDISDQTVEAGPIEQVTVGQDETYDSHLTTIAKGAGINFFGNIAGRALLMLFALLIAKFLGPRQVGLYFLGIAIINVAIMPAALGLDSGILRFVAIHMSSKNAARLKGTIIAAIIIALPLSILTMITLITGAETLASGFFHKPALASILKLLALSIPFMVMSLLFLAVLQALKLMHLRVISRDLADGAAKLIFAASALALGLGLFGAALATVIATGLTACIAFFFMNKSVQLTTRAPIEFNFGELLKFSIPQTFSKMLFISRAYMDTLLVGFFLSASHVGIYSVASRIAMLLIVIHAAFRSIFAPIVADLYDQKDSKVLSDLFKSVSTWMFTISFPISLLLIILAKPILQIVGPAFIDGAVVLMLLGFAQMVIAASGPSAIMLVMAGKPVLELLCNLIAFALSVILSFILIPRYGIIGAGLATAISILTVNLLRLGLVQKKLHMNPYKSSFLKPLVAGLAATLVVLTGNLWLSGQPPVILIGLLGTVFGFIYVAILRLFRPDDEDQLLAQVIRNRFSFLGPMLDFSWIMDRLR